MGKIRSVRVKTDCLISVKWRPFIWLPFVKGDKVFFVLHHKRSILMEV